VIADGYKKLAPFIPQLGWMGQSGNLLERQAMPLDGIKSR